MAVVAVPLPGAGIASAAPAMLEAAFRDLPLSVRTGDALKVQVDVPGDASCSGLITYRDNSTQKLPEITEDDHRCRWDIIVPDETRRGEADIDVTVNDGGKQGVLSATFGVVRRSDDLGVVLREMPGTVKRDAGFTIRIDVGDDATCQGTITYADDRTQSMDLQTENKERCRWSMTVPSDAARGTARVRLGVIQDGIPTILATSFEVGKDNDDAPMMLGFQDLPGNIRRDDTLSIRVIAPAAASCTGEIAYRSGENVVLDPVAEQYGQCRWSVIVPTDIKKGEATVDAKVTAGGKTGTVSATLGVESSASNVKAEFDDLADERDKGDDLDVRVNVAKGSTCRGWVSFDDGVVRSLDPQTAEKPRCRWSIKIPTVTPRGTAVVRVWVNDGTQETGLVGNVAIAGGRDDSQPAAWSDLPKSVKPGDSLDLKVDVPSGSTCTGQISYADGMLWRLGTTEERNSQCKWNVDVPPSVGAGKATLEIKIDRNGKITTLTSAWDVKVKQQPATDQNTTAMGR